MEKQKTIGEILRAGRKAKGLDFQQVSSKLCIAKSYLRALEADDKENLPCRTYAIGFLRTYSGFLELDADAMVRRAKDVGDPTQQMQDAIVPEPVHDSGMPHRSLVLAALVGVGSLIYGVASLAGGHSVELEAAAPAAHVASLLDATIASPAAKTRFANRLDAAIASPAPAEVQPSVLEAAEKLTEQPAEPAMLAASNISPAIDDNEIETAVNVAGVEIKATRDTWVMVVGENNHTLLNGVIRPGESFRTNEGRALLLSTGNADNLQVYIDGELIAPLGGRGHILDGLRLNISHLRAEARQE
jgi:cytoskeletal protein RodZ